MEARGAVGVGGERQEVVWAWEARCEKRCRRRRSEARCGRGRRDARGEEWAWEARGAASCGRGSGVVRNVGRLFID